MDINSIYSSTGVLFAESVYGENTVRKSDDASTKESGRTVSSWGEDVVTISEQAREKLAAQGSAEKEEDAQAEENAGDQADTGSGSVSGGGGDGGSSSDSTAKLESLKAKLSALQTSLSHASGPDVTSVNALISQVMAEIAALQSKAA
ncbi:MAG: hypothetical protein LBP38_06315 [Desulfovibrio sp.]|jgi:hypothetical protein|nr:hypothetical protein [Desulfovibrio sp.]